LQEGELRLRRCAAACILRAGFRAHWFGIKNRKKDMAT